MWEWHASSVSCLAVIVVQFDQYHHEITLPGSWLTVRVSLATALSC
jgi:hypothetical protein